MGRIKMMSGLLAVALIAVALAPQQLRPGR